MALAILSSLSLSLVSLKARVKGSLVSTFVIQLIAIAKATEAFALLSHALCLDLSK